jgi:dTDP-glucose 4,6-dehydratase
MVSDVTDRPGHDVRYGLDGSKLDDMGFEYPVDFEDSIDRTIKWILTNPKWLGQYKDTDAQFESVI